jgi:hypothetical protein
MLLHLRHVKLHKKSKWIEGDDFKIHWIAVVYLKGIRRFTRMIKILTLYP